MNSGPFQFGSPRYRTRWELADMTGPVVVIDVLRAFTTAAYALAGGASTIMLVDSVEEAFDYCRSHPGVLAVGEHEGELIDGFDLGNSPARVAVADLTGREIVLRTSAGTRGVIAARDANARPIWCAALVNASATAQALRAAGAEPTYLITGWYPNRAGSGRDDLAVAQYIEALRRGEAADGEAAARRVAMSWEAAHVASLAPIHADPSDVAYAIDVDRFCFPMPLAEPAILRRP